MDKIKILDTLQELEGLKLSKIKTIIQTKEEMKKANIHYKILECEKIVLSSRFALFLEGSTSTLLGRNLDNLSKEKRFKVISSQLKQRKDKKPKNRMVKFPNYNLWEYSAFSGYHYLKNFRASNYHAKNFIGQTNKALTQATEFKKSYYYLESQALIKELNYSVRAIQKKIRGLERELKKYNI